MKISLKINGEQKELDFLPYESLLTVLRRYGYKGVKKGCGQGECGSCLVLLDGRPVNSCMVFAGRLDNSKVITIEGIGTPDKPDIIQEELVKNGAVQCGYCTPGMVISTRALLNRKKNPSETEIKEVLDGNLCRCTGYVKIIEAIKNVVKKLNK